ncbi:MAG: hypothetical protein Q9168_003864 [Polycauliona sp. 1 TL-2023]
MDSSSTAAAWLSFTVTAIGLGSLMSQASAIREQMDPFHNTRGAEHLGTWVSRQLPSPWYRIARPSPVGPKITAKMSDGFCGSNGIHVSRLPFERTGKANWTGLLAILHKRQLVAARSPPFEPALANKREGVYVVEIEGAPNVPADSPSWASLETRPLVRHGSTACTVVSRATLITLLSLCNARCIFRHSGAAGYRATYPSYSGQWYIEWPIGAPAVVHFTAHDSHSLSSDVYPASFERRIDKCVQMTAGVIVAPGPNSLKCAFPGRKPPGIWLLEYQPRGFPGAHGSRHLYNMMGGKVYEVDFLFARRCTVENDLPPHELKLTLPSKEKGQNATFCIPSKEQQMLAHLMDCLPWSPLSWSIHRGLRDLLLAFSKPTMNKFRRSYAQTLRDVVHQTPTKLEARGWEPKFIRESMPDIAFSSVMAGAGDSGDAVRIVTDVALLSWEGPMKELDETSFWREQLNLTSDNEQSLTPQMVIALTKCFVLEWSIEFDYQIYHDLPTELLFG